MRFSFPKPLVLVIAAAFFASCKDDAPSEKNDAGAGGGAGVEATASTVLKAFQANDVKMISPHLASANEKLKTMSNEEFAGLLRGWRREAVDAWDGKIHGVRYRHYVGTARNDYEAHVKFGEMGASEIAVVKLVRENGEWLFEDLGSPDEETWLEGKTEFSETEESY